jgi:hypothetical protein
VWPVEVDLKFLEPVGKELKMLGKVKANTFIAMCLNQIYPLVYDLVNMSQYLG